MFISLDTVGLPLIIYYKVQYKMLTNILHNILSLNVICNSGKLKIA